MEGGLVYPTICPRDAMVFLNPRWSDHRYAEFYADGYDGVSALRTGAANEYPVFQERARQIVQRFAASGHHLEGRSLLDVGAGYGWMAQSFRDDYGAEAVCIEPSDEARSQASNRGIPVVGAWPSDVTGHYDIVTARHVVEHLLHPASELAEVASLLAPTGAMYIAVPNMLRPKRPMSGHWWRAVHTSYFTARTLAQVLSQSGLTIMDIDEWEHEIWVVASPKVKNQSHTPPIELSRVTALEQRQIIRRAERHDIYTRIPRMTKRFVKRQMARL